MRERRSGDRPDSPTTGPASAGPKAGSEADAKAELRRLMAARRGGSGPRAAQTGGAEIARRVLALPEVATAVWVAAFVGLPNEPDTRQLLAALRAHGTRVLLPAVREDLDLDFREFTGALVPGALGTREPPPAAPAVDLAAADVVLVPAVAVDRRGHRLGRGGGSYDRALRRVHPQAPLVAVVDDLAIVDGVPVDAHDLSVSVIVTPTQVVRRGPV
ncbi:5-formyltetrahydrofolate cyclo-ligase [Pseudofrankia sp. BMG5.36]|uniref:5-formyltetrahydrofolate cyclo-ligase n=1 Tax=Pseudofrankia sp. BMG5.36 TaxID=1834512 RepID=UPI00237875EB|nr:5-formyltetrahydrofolate cyclo-ligase [Pseudofrankia sp. BMG5.36]